MVESLSDFSGIGLAALVVVLGYWVLVKMQALLAHHYERQELLLQKILLAQMSCAEELHEMREEMRGSR